MTNNVPPNAVDRLARYLISERRQKLRLTGGSTAGGRNADDTMNRLLPIPIGDEGDVLTVVDDGGDLVPQWTPSSGGGGGGSRYQNYIYELDGSGGFDWITDDDGNPMYVLADLE